MLTNQGGGDVVHCPSHQDPTMHPFPLSVTHALAQGARENQEDCLLVQEEQGVFAVFDGLGGHADGEVASRMASDVVAAELVALNASATPDEPLRFRIDAALRRAHDALVAEERHRRPYRNDRPMATTAVGVVQAVDEDGAPCLHLFNTGDSLAVRIRAGQVQVVNHAQAGWGGLSHCLGYAFKVDQDILDWQPGDVVILATDGVLSLDLDSWTDPAVLPQPFTAGDVVQAVLAKHAPHQDNVTVIVLSDPR